MANSQVSGSGTITPAKANEITTGDTAPTSPVEGQVWVDTAGAGIPVIKTWDGAAWQLSGVQPSMLTAAGDMIYATGASVLARLPISAEGNVLRVISGLPAWSNPYNGAAPATVSAHLAAGSAGSGPSFAHNDHAHGSIDPVLAQTGTSAGTTITLANIPGYSISRGCRIRLTIGDGATSSLTMRLNSDSAAAYEYYLHGLSSGATHGVTNSVAQTSWSVTGVTCQRSLIDIVLMALDPTGYTAFVSNYMCALGHGTSGGNRNIATPTTVNLLWNTSAPWKFIASVL